MNNLIIYLKKYSKILKIISLSLLVGLTVGIFVYNKIDNTLIFSELNNIEDILKNNHLNYILYHFFIISLLVASSLTIIGAVSFILYFIFEGISICYNILCLTHVYHLKGFIYSIFYVSLTKIVFLILLTLLFIRIFNILKLVITKKEINFKTSIYHNFKSIVLIIFLIFLNDLLIILFGHLILLKLLILIN